MSPPAPIATVLIGAGQRGLDVYAGWIVDHPGVFEITGVVEPDPVRRRLAAHRLGLDDRALWPHLPAIDPLPEWTAAIVATPDRDHLAGASWALDRGLHVLVEKPMAATLGDTYALVDRAARAAGSLSVGHVLKTTHFYESVHRVVDSGRLGSIVSIAMRENVAAWHMAHSFVRGNWARADSSTPMIVAKSCHDFDVLAWLAPTPVRRLTSTGSLFEFRPEHAPPGSTERCTDGCPVHDCPYDARHIYLAGDGAGWPFTVLAHDPSRAARLSALETGPYGRCVYRAQSDVVDHQAVVMELEDGADVTFTMHGHSHDETRTIRIDGTRGTLIGTFGAESTLSVHDHRSGTATAIDVTPAEGGHHGGDAGLLTGFARSIRGEAPPSTSAEASLEGHLLAFLAEEARISGEWIDVAGRRRASR